MHIWDVPIAELMSARKLVIAASFTGLLNSGFTKVSVLLLYQHLAPPTRQFQYPIYILIAICVLWMVSQGITTFLLCIPLHSYWEISYLGKQVCLDEVTYYVAFSTIDLTLDTIIYILPLPILIPLHMPMRKKAIVSCVFAVGLL
jgi:hypothetical protein